MQSGSTRSTRRDASEISTPPSETDRPNTSGLPTSTTEATRSTCLTAGNLRVLLRQFDQLTLSGDDRRELKALASRAATYSRRNVEVLWLQGRRRGLALGEVRSYRAWRATGRQVRCGEKAFYVLAPLRTMRAAKPDAGGGRDDDGDVMGFTGVAVFDHSQTEPIPRRDAQAAAVSPSGEVDVRPESPSPPERHTGHGELEGMAPPPAARGVAEAERRGVTLARVWMRLHESGRYPRAFDKETWLLRTLGHPTPYAASELQAALRALVSEHDTCVERGEPRAEGGLQDRRSARGEGGSA